MPAWIDPRENTQQENNGQTDVEVTDIPDFVIDHEWPSIMDSPACLSRYCLFGGEEDLNSYVDIIIPDIVQTAALVAFHSFQPFMVADDIKKFKSRMKGYYIDLKTAMEFHNGNANMPSPAAILAAYEKNPGIRRFVNEMACLCTSPTFIPALNKHICKPISEMEGNKICPEAFVLSHAIQIMLFAPQKWDPKRKYSRDHKYAHRFPFCNTLGFSVDLDGDIRTRLCVKDIRRAILLFYYLVKRRDGSLAWIDSPTNISDLEASSHVQDTDVIAPVKALDTIDINTLLLESLTTTRPGRAVSPRIRDSHHSEMPPLDVRDLRETVDHFMGEHHQPDFDALLARSRQTETQVTFQLRRPGMTPFVQLEVDASAKPQDIQNPPTIVLEECNFGDGSDLDVELRDADEKSKVSEKIRGRADDDFDEHRKGNLRCFDLRNLKILNSNQPYYSATLEAAKTMVGVLEGPRDRPLPVASHQSDAMADIVGTYDMARGDGSCGLKLLHDQTNTGPSMVPPSTRLDYVRLVCSYSPIMTRALDLAIKYCKDNKERLLVYVEDPWIQCILVGLFVTAGFDVGTVRPSDGTVETDRIIREWNNPRSGLEIFVANIYTKVMDVDMQKCCSKALVLDWPLEPQRLLRTTNHMVKNTLNGREPAMIHMLKLCWSYQDEVERICCTKWAIQLSNDINLPEWMTGAVREVCIFEMIKTAWHQEFNRYAWVIMHDNRYLDDEVQHMSHHDGITDRLGHVFSIAAKLILNFPEDRKFWTDKEDIFVAGCYRFLMVDDRPEEKLTYTPDRLRENCLLAFEHAMDFIRQQLKHGCIYIHHYHEWNEQLRLGIEARARGEVSAWSDDVESQAEEQDPGVDAEADGDEETEQVNETGMKRKAGDGGEGGAKKQKTSAAQIQPFTDQQSMQPSEPERYIRSRIANACDGCKSRKVKCDGKLPCSYCTRRQKPHDCHYSPQRRRKAHSVRSPQTSERAQSTRHTTPSTPAAEPVAQIDRDNGGQIDAEDETEVPREARLVCDAQGKLIFVGDCAPLSFFQSVRQLVTTRVGQNAFAPQSSRYSVLENATAHQSRRIPGDNRTPIVHPEDVPLAVSNYLSIATGLVDLFDNRRLQDDLILWANMDQKQDDATTIVNFLVLAIGMKINDEERSQDYFEYARDKAYSNLTGNLSVSTVQMFTLITLYMLCSCQINGAFLFFGTAVRAGYSIGIHRTEVNARFGPDIHRQRDRLWKSIRVVDLFLSSSMGRPPATSDVDCTVPYQSPDENLEEPVDLLNASVQIFLVLEGVVTEIYSRRKVSLQLTEGISLQLRDWSSRWLKQLKDIVANPEAQDRAQASGACQILATYYYAVMLVSRPFLMYELCRRLSDGSVNSNGRSALTSGKSKLADACIDAASLMVDPILDLIQKGILVGHVPILVSWLFASSLVLGVGLLGGFGRVLEKYTRMAIHALDHCSKHDTHAGQYSLIAQSLLTTALEYLEKRELAERQRRTENSSQLFGLIPSDTMDSSPTFTGQSITTPSSRGRESLDRTFLQHNGLQNVGSPLFGDLDSAFLGLSESMMQTPDPSYWGGPMGNEADSGSALNLFALLDAGGGIDLTHHL
ncbi:purine utilization transcriptional regulator [Fusarium globosum]|uniref:Purine utilization transcriptional regulator n=1 Tax=Fusarium globosum TaxID=78864 RepID=A0A8H5YHD9_9HYPO|nr:purine utilization transcriptional regulator [Fusarium globosum]